MADLFTSGAVDDQEPLQTDCGDNAHKGCEKRLADLKQSLQEKYKIELDSVKSDYELRLGVSVCKMCQKTNLIDDEASRNKESGTTYEQYYSEKDKEHEQSFTSLDLNKDLELTVYKIKEEVRKDYEIEIDKIREEIIAKELKRKDEEIKLIRNQLNEAHKIEVEKLWRRYDELANKEVENSVIRVKNEVILSQELEDKAKLIEQLKIDKKELIKKQKLLTEQKQKDMDQLANDLQQSHKKEKENMKQGYEIELTTKINSIIEEKAEIEIKYKSQIDKLQEDINNLYFDKQQWQENQKKELQQLTDSIRKDILRSLELQIRAMVESGDEGEDKSQWPPELAALERQFTSKYQRQLAMLVEEHALEIADIKADYDAKLSELVKEYSIKQAEEMPAAMISTGDKNLDKIIRERDNLRSLALTLRQVVQELAHYLTNCEEELNRSIVGELIKLASPHRNDQNLQIYPVESDNSDSDSDRSLTIACKKVHFAPDVSTIVTLMDEDYLFDCQESSVDVSVHFRTELESCLERLRDEAAALLGLTSKERAKALPSTVEDRRLTSLTRQLIEEKKAKEEANSQLRDLQELVNKYEKELNDVHKELTDIKERMIKEKVAVETEFNERQSERRVQKLCLLQEKARSLLSEKGDCPPQWLILIEELCAEGDSLIEEEQRAREELQAEVEAADKQLRSTRAFLEEQAVEREQERDEYTKEIERLGDLLRERDREWTSHKNFATEVEALELQVKETFELLKEAEEKKLKVQKELKTAIDKIWELRNIISDFEAQVSNGCEQEATLKQRVAALEAELNTQSRGQADMLQELCVLRDCGKQALQNELCSLKDQLGKQSSPAIIRNIKSQLKTMAKSVDKQIKELEAVNIHVSSASLSSPSEDISIREQLEALRCSTPEEKTSCHGSPTSLVPLEEINQLNDKLLRYSRAAENIIKKLRDRDMEINLLRTQNEELQTERDVLQGQSERQLMQVASLGNRVEELRVRNDREIKAATSPLYKHIQELEKQSADLNDQLKDSNRQLAKMKQKLERSEALVMSQESRISSLSEHQEELVEKLTQDLETMRAEKQQMQIMVEKYRAEDNVSFPQLVEVMLAEKNADIDQLQQRVEELLNQKDQVCSKGDSHQTKNRYRVSFADDIAESRLTEGERVRDANFEGSSIKPFFSTPLSSIEEGGNRIIPRVIGEDISKIQDPVDIVLSSSPNRAVQLENVLSQLKSELELKNNRLLECEAQLKELPILEQELNKAKQELVETVKAVSEDKQFYEDQLKTLGQTKDMLAEREAELKKVRAELEQKDEDIVKTTADVKALQLIMEGLQQKLKEAKSFAENCDNRSAFNDEMQDLKKVSDDYKVQCNSYKKTIEDLEKQIIELKEVVSEHKKSEHTLRETVVKLETDKQNILSELVMTKSKCKTLQEDLETALLAAKDSNEKVQSLKSDLENASEENKELSGICQRLKKEMDRLTKKQKVELKNILKKDSEKASKMKEELESLRSSNSELQSECEQLKQELNDVGNNLDLLKELNSREDKIQQLEGELQQLDENYKSLKSEKLLTENSLNNEISELKVLIDDLNKNITSLETESKESHDCIQDRDNKENLRRRYEALKREYERQRRARRESEKKYSVLKNELAKEKEFSSHLQNKTGEKRLPRLQITKTNMIDIKSEGVKIRSSLDDLTDEVQKELNASAQLDQSLISGLQHQKETETTQLPRSESMPPRVDYLTERLAEMETALRVEQVVVSELRARLAEERARFLEERQRVTELKEEVACLHTLNDQFQDKFKNIAWQLEKQVKEVKAFKEKEEPTDALFKEKEKLRQLMEEKDRRVKELLQERIFNRNQLVYLREELSKLIAEKDSNKHSQVHGHGDVQKGVVQENLQQAIDFQTKELEQEQKKNLALQKMLEKANHDCEKHARELMETASQTKDLQFKMEELKRQLNVEVELRKSLEAKIKAMESAERSRFSRRKVIEEKLKEHLSQAEKVKKELERECLGLQLKLKQSHLQLTAHAAESPLALRLREANMAVERLVGEKEDLISANTLLKVEKEDLQRKVRDQDGIIEDFKSRIHALNIKVTDGGIDNLNAMFAAERTAWLREKESLKKALAQTQTYSVRSDSFTNYSNSAHILKRYLRAESHRKALVWQKRYLMVTLKGYQEEERHTIAALGHFSHPPSPPPPTLEHRFRVVVCAVRALSRMQFLVEHRKRADENTCRVLQRALNNARNLPQRAENVHGLQSLKTTEAISSRSTLPPGSLSQYVDHFNTIQDRIKSTMSSAS